MTVVQPLPMSPHEVMEHIKGSPDQALLETPLFELEFGKTWAAVYAIGCRIKQSVDIPTPSTKDWLDLLDRLNIFHKSMQFSLGDVWNFGDLKYGEQTAQARVLFGRKVEVMRNYGYVCRRVPFELRSPRLSWSHHYNVAALGDTRNYPDGRELQKKLLSWAAPEVKEEAVTEKDPETGVHTVVDTEVIIVKPRKSSDDLREKVTALKIARGQEDPPEKKPFQFPQHLSQEMWDVLADLEKAESFERMAIVKEKATAVMDRIRQLKTDHEIKQQERIEAYERAKSLDAVLQ